MSARATRIGVFDRQDAIAVDAGAVRRFAEAAAVLCLERRTNDAAPLALLDEIEISLIDDAAIARVHAEFLGLPGPTDVIAFDHGEILVSAEMAAAQAAAHGNSPAREIATYIAHALLHLAGHRDDTPEGFESMRALQEEVVAQCRA